MATAKQESMYVAVQQLALNLQKQGKTMKCSELLNWINSNFVFEHSYGGVRGVLSAAHRRTCDPVIKCALENGFLNEKNEPLSWSF